MTIVEPAPAKINLALHVRGRRDDGYHDLETLFAFARDGDVLTVEPAEADAFAVTGPFAGVLAGEEPATNLVVRARDAFVDAFGIAARHAIMLNKHLPVASGIGGGSADAAATLRGLARIHAVDVEDARLVEIAAALGADVPACLAGRAALGTGRGDELVPVDLPACVPLLLVNPGVAVATAAVFRGWDGIDRGPIAAGPALAAAAAGRNDLEPAALAIAPVIAQVLAMLAAAPGATLVRMSGSGATCFALFDGVAARDAAAIAASGRGWWALASSLAST